MEEFPRAGSEYGWRRRPLPGALRLRPPIAHHSGPEGRLLERQAAGARCAVEVGVGEGMSAQRMLRVLHPQGELHLVDPFPAGRLGISLGRITARRAVRGVSRGRVVWIRKPSSEAAEGWDRPIDFLFLDSDHTFEAVTRSWEDWSPHVRIGGKVLLQGARTGEDSWVDSTCGPARLFDTWIASSPKWQVTDGVGATLALERTSVRFAEPSGTPERHIHSDSL